MAPEMNSERVHAQSHVPGISLSVSLTPDAIHIHGEVETAGNGKIHVPVFACSINKVIVICSGGGIERPFQSTAFPGGKCQRITSDIEELVIAPGNILNPQDIIHCKKCDSQAFSRKRTIY